QTGEDRRLTNNTWEWDKHPSFNSDGSQIVFWSNREAQWKHIWLMNADGSEQHNLSGWLQSNDWDPVWVKEAPTAR
ncbi:MAG: TolB family protein, partial [Anaerolineae bacterium]